MSTWREQGVLLFQPGRRQNCGSSENTTWNNYFPAHLTRGLGRGQIRWGGIFQLAGRKLRWVYLHICNNPKTLYSAISWLETGRSCSGRLFQNDSVHERLNVKVRDRGPRTKQGTVQTVCSVLAGEQSHHLHKLLGTSRQKQTVQRPMNRSAKRKLSQGKQSLMQGWATRHGWEKRRRKRQQTHVAGGGADGTRDQAGHANCK